MTLDKTVDLMLSEDPTDRFKAEYHQLTSRRNKLAKEAKAIEDVKAKKDLYVLYKWQLRAMDDYIYILKFRAEREGIALK